MCVSGGEEDRGEGSGVREGQAVLQTGESEKAGAPESQHLSRHLKVESKEPHQHLGGELSGLSSNEQERRQVEVLAGLAAGAGGCPGARMHAGGGDRREWTSAHLRPCKGSELYPEGCGRLVQGFEQESD